jgi:hypothetical protein
MADMTLVQTRCFQEQGAFICNDCQLGFLTLQHKEKCNLLFGQNQRKKKKERMTANPSWSPLL